MALRIGIGFIVLMGLNVAVALWWIAWREGANPNHKLLEEQMRQQVRESAGRAATGLTPPPLDLNEITVPTPNGKLDRTADGVIAIVQRLGGTATKGLPDAHRISIVVEIPANRETEFRALVAAMSGPAPGGPLRSESPSPGAPAKNYVVQIVESGAP
jgi:hypothetical protein